MITFTLVADSHFFSALIFIWEMLRFFSAHFFSLCCRSHHPTLSLSYAHRCSLFDFEIKRVATAATATTGGSDASNMTVGKNQHGWLEDKNPLVRSNKNWEKNAQTLKKEWSPLSSGFLWHAFIFRVYVMRQTRCV